MKKGIVVSALLGLSLSVGCVSQAKYTELENMYDKQVVVTDQLQQRVDQLEARSQRDLAAFQELLADFKPLMDKGILDVTVVDGRMTVALSSDVLFESGSASLSEDGQTHIKVIAGLLAKRTEQDFQVEGHTDADPIASEQFPSNLHLGAARAITVTELMLQAGMSPERLSAATFGKSSPVSGNDSDEGKALNRRIEIVLLPDLTDMPSYEALMKIAADTKPMRKGPKRPRPPRNP